MFPRTNSRASPLEAQPSHNDSKQLMGIDVLHLPCPTFGPHRNRDEWWISDAHILKAPAINVCIVILGKCQWMVTYPRNFAYLSMCLSIDKIDLSSNLSISIYLSFYLSICLSIYLSFFLSIYPIYLSTYLPIYLSTYLPIYLSIYLSIYPSIYLCLPISIYLSIYLSI